VPGTLKARLEICMCTLNLTKLIFNVIIVHTRKRRWRGKDMDHYIQRRLEAVITKHADQYPAVAVTGPRQSGKTTLVRRLFSDYPYYSLESIDNRRRAQEDPRQFLSDIGRRAVLDEVQRVPELFSYLQEYLDDPYARRHYILTGSHQFLLMEKITQSLAGRIANFHLFPLTVDELYRKDDEHVAGQTKQILTSKQTLASNQALTKAATTELLLRGFYPRIHDRKLDPTVWYEGYVQTYLERDVRQIINVADTRQFETFLKVIAGNSGQVLNKAGIANRIGTSEPTVRRWISVLETSGILLLVPPYYRNLNKRLIKSPKLYLLDSGLLCFLLGISSQKELTTHPLYGNIFESFIVAELYKRAVHSGRGHRSGFYYWRDKTGHEIDLLIEEGMKLLPIEIKSAATYHSGFAADLSWWLNLPGNETDSGLIIYDGSEKIGQDSTTPCVPWRQLDVFA